MPDPTPHTRRSATPAVAATTTRAIAAAMIAAACSFAAPVSAAEPSVAAEVRQNRMAQCKAALGGNQDQAFRLARRHLFGMGVRRNPRTGVAWLRVAAAMGHGEAARLLMHVPRNMGAVPPSCDGGAAGWGGRSMRPATPPAEIRAMVDRLAPQYGLDPGLVLTVMQIESSFRSNVVSPKAAAGLMQLIPATAERFGVEDVFDAEDNARGGMKYLRWLLSYFRGDVILATAAYNAGEGAVDRHKGVPPYAETQNYVSMVRSLYGAERHGFDPSVAGPSPLFRGAADQDKPAAKKKS